MNVRGALLVLTIIALLFTSGCWDYMEYEDMALVSSLGIDFDKTTNEVKVTVEYLIPGGNSGSDGKNRGSSNATSSTAVHRASGVTINDAVMKIQNETGKKLFYGYINIQVVGREAAENIMKDIMILLDRTPTIRTTSYLAVTPGTAEDVILTYDPETSEETGRNIHDLISQSINSGSAYPTSMEDFSENLAISGIEAVSPIITIHKNTQSEQGGNNSGGQGKIPGMPEGSSEGHQKISGLAVFNNDKLVGWMEGKEAIGLGWINNKGIKPYETVKLPGDAITGNTLIFHVSKSKSNIKVKLKDNKPVFFVNTYVEADLRKYTESIDSELLTPDVVGFIEEGLEENVSAEINAAIKKGQKELKSDVFGFGFNFFRQHPRLWHSQYEDAWQDIFPDVSINVSVKAKIINTGTSIKRLLTR